MDLGLRGKVALVTASSRGIGFAVARKLAQEGAIVTANARAANDLDAAFAPLAQSGASVSCQAGDLSDERVLAGIMDRVLEAHGRLDILVVNTPGPRITAFLDAKSEDWADAYNALAKPALHLAHAAARQMVKQRGGNILFLTSTWVKQPVIGGVLSTAIRSLISGLSKQMALELAPFNVRVNQVMPGATGTDRMKAIVAMKAANGKVDKDAIVRDIVEQIPLARWAEPEEIADTVAFLVSPRASFTTGVALAVDGGAVRQTL